MSDNQPRTKAVEDFDFIRDRLAQIKKEQEEAAKTTSSAPTNSVPVASETDYCCGFSELSTGPRAIINKAYSDFDTAARESYKEYCREYPLYDALDELENVFEDYTLNEADEIMELTEAYLYT